MMRRHYRLTVVVCAISWLLVGLHLPTLHELTDHGYSPQWTVLGITVLLALVGAACVRALLRTPAASSTASSEP